MKKIEAIVRPEKLEAVLYVLKELGLQGYYADERVKGIGHWHEGKHLARDPITNHLYNYPKAIIVVVVNENEVDQIVKAISAAAHTQKQNGVGKIFITEVEQAYSIHRGQAGAEALEAT